MTSDSMYDSFTFSVIVEGKDVSTKYNFTAIHTKKEINKISKAKIYVNDEDPEEGDFSYAEKGPFEIGKEIEIKAGYEGKATTIYKGYIVMISISSERNSSPTLIVECRDAAYLTTLRRKTANFPDTTDSSCINTILKKYSKIKANIENTSIKFESLVQTDITDWDFMNLRTEANGMLIYADNNKLDIKKPSTSVSPKLVLEYKKTILSIKLEMDNRDQISKTTSNVWKAEELKTEKVDANTKKTNSFGSVSPNNLASITGEGEYNLFAGSGASLDEIKTLGEGLLNYSNLSMIKGEIVIYGDASVTIGDMIKIDKLAKKFEGNAFVSAVYQKIEFGEWLTIFKIGIDFTRYINRYSDSIPLPNVGITSPIYGLQIGVVKKIAEDPKKLNRIFVQIPIIHKSNEGLWCRFSSPYATKDSGIMFLPEIEDEVTLAFINDDPRSPVILGALYSKIQSCPVKLEENNEKKIIRTKSKLEILFDEKEKIIQIQIPGDNPQKITISNKDSSIEMLNGKKDKFSMTKNGIEILSEKDIIIKAKGGLTLGSDSKLDMKLQGDINLQGNNVKITATKAATIKGTSGAEVSSSGNTVIKGLQVAIN